MRFMLLSEHAGQGQTVLALKIGGAKWKFLKRYLEKITDVASSRWIEDLYA